MKHNQATKTTGDDATLPHADEIADARIDLSRESFFAELLGHFAGTVESAMGLKNSEAFVGHVGHEIGARIGAEYAQVLGRLPNDAQGLAEILVDLKDRLGAEFEIAEATEERIVLVNTSCPFSGCLRGRETLCQVTKNIFTRIVSDASGGTARVCVEEAIARGDPGCRIVVHLGPVARVVDPAD